MALFCSTSLKGERTGLRNTRRKRERRNDLFACASGLCGAAFACASGLWCTRTLSAFATLAFLSPGPKAEAAEYRYPAIVRDGMSAELVVRVSDDGITLTATIAGGTGLEVAPLTLDDPYDAWQSTWSSSWAESEQGVVWSQTVALRQVKPGFQPLPSVRVRFRKSASAEWQEAEWTNILAEPTPAPRPAPVELSRPRDLTWPLVFIGAVAAAGLVLGALWRRIAEPREAPAAQALRAIEHAHKMPLPPQELAGKLSYIVRSYLAQCTGESALQQTTAEVLDAAKGRLPQPLHDHLSELLHRCDTARFSQAEQWLGGSDALVALARSVVQECERWIAEETVFPEAGHELAPRGNRQA